jgi:hypothetical protein
MALATRRRNLKRSDLIEIVKRRLGYPVVKIELDDAQIIDNIEYAKSKFIKWAAGQSTQEIYFALPISAGVNEYDLDEISEDIIDIMGYKKSKIGSVHTLFTLDNYMYNAGMYDQILMSGTRGSDGYSILTYHIVLDFLETIERYVVDSFNFRYSAYNNTLYIDPTPKDNAWVLCRSMQIALPDGHIYNNDWMIDYITALCKVSLGRIRVKFAGFQAVGSNTSLSLDGESLLSEGNADLERLEKALREEEAYEGGWIIVG